MRYLFISGTDFEHRKLTGAHKRFIELVKAFSKENEVTLIAYPYSEFNHELIKYYPITNTIGGKLPNHISEQLTLTKMLNKYKNKIRYDYAIAFGNTAALCYKRTGYKKIITLFREDLIGYQRAVGASILKIWYFWIQEHITVKCSEKIIVQCKHDKRALINRHKGIENKIFIQGNNINVSWIKTAEHKKSSNVIPKILFIGNFSSIRKGHQLLLPAVAKLLDDGFECELFVLGDGKELIYYKSNYKKYEKIHFVGHTNKVDDYLIDCDIEIVPSLIDSCPNTVLEGLNMGLAVYGSRTGGIPDLLIENDYMFDPNVDEIYRFLRHKLINCEYKKDQVNQNNIKQRLEFDWCNAIDKIIRS